MKKIIATSLAALVVGSASIVAPSLPPAAHVAPTRVSFCAFFPWWPSCAD